MGALVAVNTESRGEEGEVRQLAGCYCIHPLVTVAREEAVVGT